MQVLKAGLFYFAVTFAVAFALGTIRVLWLVPQVGTRAAELLEMPVMLGVVMVAARWVVRRLAVPPAPAPRLGMGFIALGILLVFEFTLVLWVRGMTFEDYLATRDPVSGTAYYVLLGAFALMPLLVARK
ncbi:MAG TPA: hypothetical protein VF104_06640 [Burkholderiales bacterium]